MRVLLRQTPIRPQFARDMDERWFDLDEFTQFEDDGDEPDDPTHSLEREVSRWVQGKDAADSYQIVQTEPQVVDDDNLGDSLSDLWAFNSELDQSYWDDYNLEGLRAYAWENNEDIDDLLGDLDDLYDRYVGHYGDREEYAEEWFEGAYDEVPDPLAGAIDWDVVWDNNLAYDYTCYDHPERSGVHIFRDHA